MGNFTYLDIFWAVAFLLLMVGGAFFFYRLARRSESDFFLAGRGLPWWLPASSVFSTHTAFRRWRSCSAAARAARSCKVAKRQEIQGRRFCDTMRPV
jgi:hypothetical protein